MRMSRRASLMTLVAMTVCTAACQSCRQPAPTSVQATTPLTILITGGFRYVNSPAEHQLEIAFMKSTTGACMVHQLGVELAVKDGEIVVPATPPASMSFDPGGAVVTIGDNAAEPLTVVRSGQPVAPFQPLNPSLSTDADWTDLKWVPSLDPFYPGNKLNPNWRQMVDGRVVLTHGTLVAAKPSDDVAVSSVFTFTRPSDGATFTQALTDRTTYTGQVPGDRVIINMPGARSGITRLEIKPIGGRPVTLLLTGIHDLAAPKLKPGDSINDYCAFYELLTPVPPMNQRMLPKYMGDPSKPLAGQPSQGAYCPGEI
jgi:hypothetical protein